MRAIKTRIHPAAEQDKRIEIKQGQTHHQGGNRGQALRQIHPAGNVPGQAPRPGRGRNADYLRYSSFPFALELGRDTRQVKAYLEGIYNVKGKRQLLINDKYYCIDIALRSTLLGEKSLEVSHALENVIFLELVRRYSEVYVGKIGDLEIDFIAMRHGSPEYFQAAATVRDGKVLTRELAPLLRVRDSYPKYLLSLDRDPPCGTRGSAA